MGAEHNYDKKIYFYDRDIVGTSTPREKTVETNPISVVNSNDKLLGVGEELVISGTQNTHSGVDSNTKASEIMKNIQKICEENSIDIKLLYEGINKITNGLISSTNRQNLSPEQQAMLLTILENSLQKAVEVKNKANRKDINILEAVFTDAIITSEIIIKKKTFKDLASLDKAVNDDASELIKGINEFSSVEEFEAAKTKVLNEMHEKFLRDKKEKIDRLPKDKQAAAIEQWKSKEEAVRQRLLAHYLYNDAEVSNDFKLNARDIAPMKDLGRFQKALYNMQANDAQKEQLAKMDGFEENKRILKSYQSRGETFDSESYQQFVEVQTTWKDAVSLQQYYDDFKSAVDSKEYSFLTKEVINATNKGIGVGAQINQVMTSEEKARFIEDWTAGVKKYYGEDSKEYKELKTYVEQKVDEYNKSAQLGVKNVTSNNPTELKQDKPSSNYSTNPIYSTQITYFGRTFSQDKKAVSEIADNDDSESKKFVLSSTSSPKSIAEAIATGEITVVEAISKCKEKGYEALFESPKLFMQNITIADLYINFYRKDFNKLISLSKFPQSVELIVKRISPTIKNKYEENVNLSETEKQAIFGKDYKHAIS